MAKLNKEARDFLISLLEKYCGDCDQRRGCLTRCAVMQRLMSEWDYGCFEDEVAVGRS